MKKKYIISIIFIVFIVFIGFFYYRYFIYPYPWDKAEENFQKYITEQKVDVDNIDNIEKLKETKIGGILYRVTYKDDPNLTYEYLYCRDYNDNINPYKISLIIYDDNISTDAAGITSKYPTLEHNK